MVQRQPNYTQSRSWATSKVYKRQHQLSLGAPIFIEIPENATTSLEIAMEELKQRVIPIVIKRTLPNGDYQNIPIDQFA